MCLPGICKTKGHIFTARRLEVILGIHALQKENLPLYAKYVMKNHQNLFHGALRQYGSWDKALIAAGITNRVIPRKTRLGLLRELREAVESGSSIPRRYAQRLGITSKACEAPGLH